MFQLFAKSLCLMSMRMSHRRGLECDTAPMVSGHQSGGGVRMRNTHSHDHDIFWSALTPHSGSQQSLEFLSVT